MAGVLATPAAAVTLTVTDCGDTTPGGAPGQLRRLINDADPGDTIVVPACLITLSGAADDNANATGDLDVTKSLTIQGAGAGTILDGASVDRVFEAGAGVTATLSSLVVRNGDVADTTPPVIDASVNPTSLWPPNHKLVAIAATVAVQDICDPNPTFVLKSILSNEPDNGLGDGDTVGDIQEAAFGTPDKAFKLRAERSGNGSGRIYTVTYEAKDGSNNQSTDSAAVVVDHNR
jgi:hypothetical protein